MRYGSVCSGIEAASVAWHQLGWRPSFLSEIEAFPRAVLAHHYPEVPLHGDFTTIQAGQYEPIDVLVGGTPCQSFSVAGLRGGLDDDRGNLALEYLRLADRLRPRWVVWENVPGVLSSNKGRDFGSILGGLALIGYGWAYRILDAQFFGVPQRRRRVFVVGYLGDWRRAAAVLFERESLSGHPPPSRTARQEVTHTLTGRARSGSGYGPGTECPVIEVGAVLSSGQANAECYQDGSAPSLTCLHEAPIVAATLTGGSGKRGLSGDNGAGQGATIIPVDIAHSLPAGDGGATEDGTGRGCPLVVAPTLRTGGNDHADEYNVVPVEVMTLAIRGRGGSNDLEYRTDGTANAILTPNGGRAGIGVGAIAFAADDYATGSFGEVTEAGPLTTSADRTRSAPIIATLAVRRLTPRECERLQGFPDD